MTWRELLLLANAELGQGHEARFLLEEVSGMAAASLFSRLDEPASANACQQLAQLSARRKAGEPLQHVLGHWPFRRIELLSDGRALIPRPETELVVEHGLSELERQSGHRRETALVIDLGTGSGAIACAIADETLEVAVLAIDSSSEALELAALNVARLSPRARERVHLVCADFRGAIPLAMSERAALVIANPPYLSIAEWQSLDAVVKDYDPPAALIAGSDGFEAIAAVIESAPAYLAPDGALVVEVAPQQSERACQAAKAVGARSAAVAKDLAGRARVLIARF